MKKSQDIPKQLFEPIRKEFVSEEQYQRFETLPTVCDKLARLTNESIYIIDYSKQNFFFVSSHPLFLCGYTAQEVKEMGYAFYEKVLSPEDLQMILEINKFGWELFDHTPPAERTNACFSYDFYLHHRDGTKTLINHKLSPTFLTDHNNMWLAICTISLSSKKTSGNVVFTQNNTWEYYTYNFDTKQIEKYRSGKLTKREKEVVALMMRGFNTDEIAKTLLISTNTVRSHRVAIEQKFDVNNAANAIALFNSMF